MKSALITSLLVAMFSLSARAALYTFPFSDAGPVPQGGLTFSAEQTISGVSDSVITSVHLTLTFADSASLSGNSSGIEGLLTLGTLVTSPYMSFFPSATSSSGAQRIYDVTWSAAPSSGFNGLNPNGVWSLALWDNSTSGIENGLVSWSLGITAVPEPIHYALGLFGLVFVGVRVGRFYATRRQAV